MMDLEHPRYDSNLLDQLFTNILNDDVIHLDAECPDNAGTSFQNTLSADCYRLCWQCLDRNVDIPAFRKLVLNILLNSGTKDPAQRLTFKHVRARFKHLRFAFANLDARHTYPWSLNFVTSLMGHMQDAFRNHQVGRTRVIGVILWLALHFPFYWLVRFQMKRFRAADQMNLKDYFLKQNRKIELALKDDTVTAREFHDIRKIVSRRVAFNDTQRVLYPDQNADALSRYLATINGLMGNMHDTLIERHIAGEHDYRHDRFAVDNTIKGRLRRFISEEWKAF